MNSSFRFGQGLHPYPIISPLDIVATDVDSAWVKVSNAHHVTFVVSLGTITGDTLNITIECATEQASTSAITSECFYRYTAAVASDTYEAFTSADTLGVTVTASDDDKLLLIEYSPSWYPDYQYVRLALVTGGSMSVCEASALAVLEQRYPQNIALSAT